MKIFNAHIKNIDVWHGDDYSSILINESDAWEYGIRATDKISVTYKGEEIISNASITKHMLKPGTVGVSVGIWEKYQMKNGDTATISFSHQRHTSLEAIKKKLLGITLNEKEITAIIEDIAKGRLTSTLTTYYVASSFLRPPDKNELYYTTKAMAKTGEMIKFSGIAADKHCIGGVPGNETTMIIVPLIASLGIKIPKVFSKAITSPAATGECVNVLMDIAFNTSQIKGLVKINKCCLVWGGGLDLAPADDKIIKVSYPLSMQPKAKTVISIMAKKIAMGITHCLIDIPIGPTAKVINIKEAKSLKKQFLYVAKKFGMKMHVEFTEALGPIGNGIGANLQVREVLRVLQQHPQRPHDLEEKVVRLAAKLIELVKHARGQRAIDLARKQLESGAAWAQMQKIIWAQNGNPDINSEELKPGEFKKNVRAKIGGYIKTINLKFINDIGRALGCPMETSAGLYLAKKHGENVNKGDILFTMYAKDEWKLKMAEKMLSKNNPYEII